MPAMACRDNRQAAMTWSGFGLRLAVDFPNRQASRLRSQALANRTSLQLSACTP